VSGARRPDAGRYDNSPLCGQPELPRSDRERRQRWQQLLAEKNRLITELRKEIVRLRIELSARTKERTS